MNCWLYNRQLLCYSITYLGSWFHASYKARMLTENVRLQFIVVFKWCVSQQKQAGRGQYQLSFKKRRIVEAVSSLPHLWKFCFVLFAFSIHVPSLSCLLHTKSVVNNFVSEPHLASTSCANAGETPHLASVLKVNR
jgi:hypothetical protein